MLPTTPLSEQELSRGLDLLRKAGGGDWRLHRDGKTIRTSTGRSVIASIRQDQDEVPATLHARGELIAWMQNALPRIACELRSLRASAVESTFATGVSEDLHALLTQFGNATYRLARGDASHGDPHTEIKQARESLERGIAALETEVRRLRGIIDDQPSSNEDD